MNMPFFTILDRLPNLLTPSQDSSYFLLNNFKKYNFVDRPACEFICGSESEVSH